jgi:DNA-binding SARP family transcriptional activator
MPQRPSLAAIVDIDPPRTRLRRDGAAKPVPATSLTLLGGFLLKVDGAVVDFPTAMQRLVAVLALRGRMSRSRLAGTLWPETTEHRALARLRTGIWRINNVTDRLVVSTSGTVDLGAEVDVDVQRLIADSLAIMRAEPPSPVENAHAMLDDAGDLLPDWEDEWLLADRERLRQMRLHVLEAVAEQLTDRGSFGLAMEAALAALRMDSLRESAHRTVISIHLAEGNISDARRAYDRCRLIMVRDVGVEPSPAITRLLAFDRADRRPLDVLA